MRPAISAIAIPALACALGARGAATLDDKPSMSRLADLGLRLVRGLQERVAGQDAFLRAMAANAAIATRAPRWRRADR